MTPLCSSSSLVSWNCGLYHMKYDSSIRLYPTEDFRSVSSVSKWHCVLILRICSVASIFLSENKWCKTHLKRFGCIITCQRSHTNLGYWRYANKPTARWNSYAHYPKNVCPNLIDAETPNAEKGNKYDTRSGMCVNHQPLWISKSIIIIHDGYIFIYKASQFWCWRKKKHS